MLDKESRREYQRKYRLKRSFPPGVVPPVLAMNEGKAVVVRDRLETAGAVHPVVLEMIADLEKRVSKLEAASGARRSAAGVGDDLFSKVMAEKSKRLGGR